MNKREPARPAVRHPGWTLLAALTVLAVAVIGLSEHHSPATSHSSSARPPTAAQPVLHRPRSEPPRDPDGAVGDADGLVPAGITVFDERHPAVTKLNPALRVALRRAAAAAARSGITFYVNSGWRSPAYQAQLLREAISKYGSEQAAERWVATPDTSAHVSGEAVDIGRSDATSWLSHHGAAYGLCQIYRNESWHYELRSAAAERGCPQMYADPTYDPRMQQ
jgi:hypothetical protein